MVLQILLVLSVLSFLALFLIILNLALPQFVINIPIVISSAIILEFLFISLLIIRHYQNNKRFPNNPIEIAIDASKYLIIITVWFIISIMLVQCAVWLPKILYTISSNSSLVPGNNSTPNSLEYKDIVTLYLNSWLTTALALVGSVEAYNILYKDKKNREENSQKDDTHDIS